jgi:hypothetical protein
VLRLETEASRLDETIGQLEAPELDLKREWSWMNNGRF